MRIGVFIILVAHYMVGFSQFDPAGGETGSKAIHRDNVSISYWGDSAVIERGKQRINAHNSVVVSTGELQDAFGAADNRTVSLGDGGQITYFFNRAISNIEGPDFVVFENGFEWAGGYFLELAFVEVSSDGKNFVRFPSESAADTTRQIENLAYMECEWYHNLAGKHQAPYGTPFDLNELKDSTQVDVTSITHIRLIDVVGNVNDSFARRDKNNRIINDPWPTDFESGGFDIDAIGVLQFPLKTTQEDVIKRFVRPNPTSSSKGFTVVGSYKTLLITDMNGRVVYEDHSSIMHHAPTLSEGIYTIHISSNNIVHSQRLCVTP